MATTFEKLQILCGKIAYLFEIHAEDIEFIEFPINLPGGPPTYYKSLRRSPNTEDVLYIKEDRPGESYRLLFLQLKKQMGQTPDEFLEGRKQVCASLPGILQTKPLFKDAMLGLADLCYKNSCVMHGTGLLFRKEEELLPLTEEDRKNAGLVGIPLEHLKEGAGEKEVLARVYSAGLPPLLLLRDNAVSFPTRSWFPAGLLKEWQPWKQNVEFRAGDHLALHGELKSGGKETLQEFHASLYQDLKAMQGPVSVLRISLKA